MDIIFMIKKVDGSYGEGGDSGGGDGDGDSEK